MNVVYRRKKDKNKYPYEILVWGECEWEEWDRAAESSKNVERRRKLNEFGMYNVSSSRWEWCEAFLDGLE